MFNKQLDAWTNCYYSIHQTLTNFVIKNPNYGKLEIIFEYAIAKIKNGTFVYNLPFRVDVIILSKSQATLLEYKSSKNIRQSDIKKDVNQLIKYISILSNHHEEAMKMKVDGALIYSKYRNLDEYHNNYLVVSTNKFGKRISDLVNYNVSRHPNVDKWINSNYI